MHDNTILKVEERKAMEHRSTTLPMVLIGAGSLLLLGNLLHLQMIDYLWPGFVIGPAMLLLWPAYRSTSAQQHILSFLAIPGGFLLTTGAILFVTNLTGYFDSWAYAWPLLLAGAAGGLSYWKRFQPEHPVHRPARRFIRAMVLLALALMTVFELLVFNSLGPWWPLLLVGYGLYLYRRQR